MYIFGQEPASLVSVSPPSKEGAAGDPAGWGLTPWGRGGQEPQHKPTPGASIQAVSGVTMSGGTMRNHHFIGQRWSNSGSFSWSHFKRPAADMACGLVGPRPRAKHLTRGSSLLPARPTTLALVLHLRCGQLRSGSGRQEVTALSGWRGWTGVSLELPNSRPTPLTTGLSPLQGLQLSLRSEKQVLLPAPSLLLGAQPHAPLADPEASTCPLQTDALATHRFALSLFSVPGNR